MRTTAILAALAVVATAAAQTTTTTQMGGWGAASTYNMLYKAENEVSVGGKIIGYVETKAPALGMTPVTTILIKSANGGVSTVDLGPAWYLNNLGIPIHIGDTVDVTGAKAVISDRSFVMARTVSKNGRTLYLREKNGFPLWVASRGPLPPTSAKENPGILRHGGIDANLPVYAPVPPLQANSNVPVQTINGTVQNMATVTNPQTGQQETVLLVNTPQGVVSVDVGPQWYSQQQGFAFNPGANVVAQATPYFQVPNSPTPIYIANGLTYGNQVFMFRNSMGYPVWSPYGP